MPIGEEHVRICGGLGPNASGNEKSSHNKGVIEYVGWVVLALVAAGAVLVAAAFVSNDRPEAGRGLSGFLSDVRAGGRELITRFRGRGQQDDPLTRERRSASGDVAQPTSIDDFFSGAQSDGDGYMQADEIGATLDRARAAVRVRMHSSHPPAQPPGARFPASASPVGARRPSGVSGHVPASGSQSGLPRSRSSQQN